MTDKSISIRCASPEVADNCAYVLRIELPWFTENSRAIGLFQGAAP